MTLDRSMGSSGDILGLSTRTCMRIMKDKVKLFS